MYGVCVCVCVCVFVCVCEALSCFLCNVEICTIGERALEYTVLSALLADAKRKDLQV
jgi:hypothetical protein